MQADAPPDVALAHEALMQFLYQAPVGLIKTTLDGTIEIINPMAARWLIPLSGSGLIDNLFAALAGVAPHLVDQVNEFSAPNGTVVDSLRLSPPDGNPADRPLVLSISVVKLDPAHLMVTLADVTLEAQRERDDLALKLHSAARLDSLTQMPNRAAMRDLIQQTLDHGTTEPGGELAVIFINCDRFKTINESLGQASGDEVLSLMAERLRSTLRQRNRLSRHNGIDGMAARFGGDEFVVLLADLLHPDDVHSVAQRLLLVLGQPYGIRSHQVHCSVSLGIVLKAQMSGTADTVLQDASIAMLEAKRLGGDRYAVFEPRMQERARRRSGIEAELREALANQELYLAFQPVVGLRGGDSDALDRSAGVEALVRWNHRIRGIIAPLEFIAIAEECGLIGPLGDFVLRSACDKFVEWKAALGAAAPRLLAVNLSRSQLTQPGFVDSVAGILTSTGMPPSQLQLEVTESLAAQDDTIQARLRDLKALGLTLALDDFGTGYSSLSSLHRMPVDVIKIDRSFVTEAVTSAHHRVLIEATVRVAKSLDMGTVAEGIETAAQLEVVRGLGCEKGQGYLFSKPLSPQRLADWLSCTDAGAPLP